MMRDELYSCNSTCPDPHEMARRRPRLLSYVGRWGRASGWLPPEVHRVVDMGCAFGYGTAALTGPGASRRWVVGIERDAGHVKQASHLYTWLPFVHADAAAVPLDENTVDAVVLLDMLEHVSDPATVLREVHRILRPGGYFVFSVPHQGLLADLDPLNVYPALRRRYPAWPPLESAEESATGAHRHYTLDEALALLNPKFIVDRVARTGFGLSEVLHLAFLVVFKALLGWRRVYLALLPLHFIVYLLDDLVPTGPLGYHLTIGARKVETGRLEVAPRLRDSVEHVRTGERH